MNMNLNLSFKPQELKKILPVLRALQAPVIGLVLIGVFGYTAYVVNGALNVQPDKSKASGVKEVPKITFDKSTIQTLEKLEAVSGDVPTGNLGQSSPF
jgi:hypothetical protein